MSAERDIHTSDQCNEPTCDVDDCPEEATRTVDGWFLCENHKTEDVMGTVL